MWNYALEELWRISHRKRRWESDIFGLWRSWKDVSNKNLNPKKHVCTDRSSWGWAGGGRAASSSWWVNHEINSLLFPDLNEDTCLFTKEMISGLQRVQEMFLTLLQPFIWSLWPAARSLSWDHKSPEMNCWQMWQKPIFILKTARKHWSAQPVHISLEDWEMRRPELSLSVLVWISGAPRPGVWPAVSGSVSLICCLFSASSLSSIALK